MDFFDLKSILTVAGILTVTAAMVFFDFLRKRNHAQHPRRTKTATTARPQQSNRPRQTNRIFESAVVDYATVAKRLSVEQPVEPLVAVATPSRPPVQPRIERETVTVTMAPPSPPAPSGSEETQLPAVALSPFTLPPITIDAALWERLISSQPKRNLISSADSDPKPIDTTPPAKLDSQTGSANPVEPTYRMIQDEPQDSPADPQVSGMIQQPVLEKWLASEQRFTGLVVSIGINDSDSSMWHSRGLVQSVGTYIAGLLKAKDYACRTAYDEFVMVCPGEQGALSQRRLNHISERLWDYQLRGMGACSIMFSWGGVQVQDQPLADALASATERMRETKRNGHLAPSAQAH
jgi:hypothetical protein